MDTLAEAYYVNGLQNKTIQAIKKALEKASDNRKYLISQLERFKKGAEGAPEAEKRRILRERARAIIRNRFWIRYSGVAIIPLGL